MRDILDTIKILIVEDEEGINEIEKKYLEKEGYIVDQAFDGQEALDLFGKNTYDLVLLDLMLPKVSGEEVMEQIRSVSSTPVIMISAKVDENDVIQGLKLGSDDYMTKPFSPKEMVQRVKTVLRRSDKYKIPKADILAFDNGRIQVNFDTLEVLKDDENIGLTTNEFKIPTTLFSNPQKIFTRDEIIELAFGLDYDAYDRAIDTHIKNIRQKLEDNPREPKYIKTVYGMGYKAELNNED